MKEVDIPELFVLLESKQVMDKLTDKQMAEKIGVNRSSYNTMKFRKTARTKTLLKIAEILKVKLKIAVSKKTIKPKPEKLTEEQKKQVEQQKNARKVKARRAIDDHKERKEMENWWLA